MLDVVGLLLGFALIATLTVRSYQRPAYNWDVLAYVAAALRPSCEDAQQVHERTYAAVEQVAPPAVFTDLTQASDYRKAMARDAQAFAEQAPFYDVKIAYVLAVRALVLAGVQPVHATSLVSAAAYGLLGLVLLLWSARHVGGLPAAIIAPGFLLLPAVVQAGRMATPDALAAALAVAGAWLVLARGARLIGSALLLAAALARPDAILLAAAVLITARFSAVVRLSNRGLGVGLALLAAFELAAYELLKGYPWSIYIHHTLLGNLVHPASAQSDLTPELYFRIFTRSPVLLGRTLVPLAALAALVSLAALWRSLRARRPPHPGHVLILATFASFFPLFVAFPVPWQRLYLAQYALIAIGVVSLWPSGRRAPAQPPSPAASPAG